VFVENSWNYVTRAFVWTFIYLLIYLYIAVQLIF